MNTGLIINEWRLDPIPVEQRDAAVRALEAGDILNFFNTASHGAGLWLLLSNLKRFQQLGLYEQAALYAFKASRTNDHRIWSDLELMFFWADRMRLRNAGRPLPGSGPFTLYRGVAGHGRDRRIRGFRGPHLVKTPNVRLTSRGYLAARQSPQFTALPREKMTCSRTSTRVKRRNSSSTQTISANHSWCVCGRTAFGRPPHRVRNVAVHQPTVKPRLETN
jgi:hypothetical protein